MCMSPHEMSDARIKAIIGYYEGDLDEAKETGDEKAIKCYEAKIANFTAILTERAAHAASTPDSVPVTEPTKELAAA